MTNLKLGGGIADSARIETQLRKFIEWIDTMRRLLAVALLCLTATAVTAHAQTSPPMKIITLTGNNTGTYSAPGVVSTNRLLFGFAVNEDFVAGTSANGTPFNFSPTNVTLASIEVNPTSGWKAQTDQIIDPTASDWTGYTIVWQVANNPFTCP